MRKGEISCFFRHFFCFSEKCSMGWNFRPFWAFWALFWAIFGPFLGHFWAKMAFTLQIWGFLGVILVLYFWP